ncbi:MAG: diguanylate cyclase [Lachnospirales bacterium]
MENGILYLYISTLIVSFILMYISIFKNSIIKNQYYTLYNLFVIIFTVGYLLEITATNPNQVSSAIAVQHLGFPFIPVCIYLFIKKYIDKPIEDSRIIIILFSIPTVNFIFTLTNPYTGLYFSSVESTTAHGITRAITDGTIINQAIYIYMYFIYFLMIYTMVKGYSTWTKLLRQKMLFLAVPIMVALTLSILRLFGFSPYGLDLSPIFMTLVNLYLAYYLYIKNAFLLSSYTRDYILENIDDGYILVDEKGGYLDSNKSAKRIFPKLTNIKKNNNIYNDINAIGLGKLRKNVDGTYEVSILSKEGYKSDYKISVSTLSEKKSEKVISWLITEITETKAMIDDLEYMAKYDVLAGVYNRRTFFEITSEILEKDFFGKVDFAVLMIDIDNFKSINDTYGHQYGDIVIVETARRLTSVLRKSDIVARYGGEEFVIYIENVNPENSLIVGEKLRASVNAEPFICEDVELDVTVSIGVCTFDYALHRNLDDALIDADKMLYMAKSAGKNKVEVM